MSADVFEYPVVLVRPAIAKETQRVVLYNCTLFTHTGPFSVFIDSRRRVCTDIHVATGPVGDDLSPTTCL